MKLSLYFHTPTRCHEVITADFQPHELQQVTRQLIDRANDEQSAHSWNSADYRRYSVMNEEGRKVYEADRFAKVE